MQWQRHDQSITSKVDLVFTFAALGIGLVSLYIIVSFVVSFLHPGHEYLLTVLALTQP